MNTTNTFQGRAPTGFVRVFTDGDPVITAPPATASADGDLLDGYSKTITSAVAQVGPAVVNIRVHGAKSGNRRRGQESGGSGSGFVIAPD
ncbi:MAG TPA: hypothetical protein VK815_17825, partial [Candidatus Acidoferrales bacterium]|nr:hypothetical protein [Candidatus Acidoferrales bacterium]